MKEWSEDKGGVDRERGEGGDEIVRLKECGV